MFDRQICITVGLFWVSHRLYSDYSSAKAAAAVTLQNYDEAHMYLQLIIIIIIIYSTDQPFFQT